MTTSRWLDVSAAPRDGSPILLWIQDDENPPDFPVTVGFWGKPTTSSKSASGAYSRPVAHQPPSICMFEAGCRFPGFLMPDDLRSPIKHHLVLHRIDPEDGIARFDSLRSSATESGWSAMGLCNTTNPG